MPTYRIKHGSFIHSGRAIHVGEAVELSAELAAACDPRGDTLELVAPVVIDTPSAPVVEAPPSLTIEAPKRRRKEQVP